MNPPAPLPKLMVICVAMLLVLCAMILIKFSSNQETETKLLKQGASGTSVDLSQQVGRRQATQNTHFLSSAEALDGLSEVERIQRIFGAVQKNGIWLPVTHGSEGPMSSNAEGASEPADGEAETLLYITTGTLPFGRVDEEYSVPVEAVGGRPPYLWSVESGELPDPLVLDPSTGQLAGIAGKPTASRFRIRVTDADQQSDIAEYELAIEPTTRLELLTDALPTAHSGGTYAAIVEASGGLPPYRWSMEGEFSQIGTFEIDSQSGVIQGKLFPDLESAGAPLRVIVQDQQVAVEKDLILPINTSSTENDNSEAKSESENAENDSSEMAAANRDGEITSTTEESETEVEKPTRIRNPSANPGFVPDGDAGSHASPETARLAAAVSLRRIGLTWSLPSDLEGSIVRVVRSETNFPETADSGFAVFEGAAGSTIDDQLNPGSYYYAVFAAGVAESLAEVAVTLPPASDVYPFGGIVADANLLHPAAFQAGRLPDIVTGPPRGTGLGQASADVVSLGAAANDDGGASAPYGGSLTIEFSGNQIWDGPGADFTIFENVFYLKDSSGILDPTSRFMEPATVAVSQDGVTFRQFPIDFSPRYDPESGELNLRHPFAYHRGFAGINPVLSNGAFPDPTDPRLSGGDSFDIAELGFDWVRFVRIQSIGDRWLVDSSGDFVPHNREAGAAMRSFNKSGFDLDAVAAIWHRKVESK